MTKRKMTKRQLLNAVLDAEEAKAKIDASQARLSLRSSKLRTHKEDLSKQLSELLYKDRKKSGLGEYDEEEPIVFKQHVFAVTTDYLYGSRRYYCEVTKVNSVS